MKKLLTILAFCTLLFASYDANSVPRRYVIEDHTGAWCGWCPMGIEAIDQLLEKHKDLIIPIGVHNGDAMVTPYQAQLGSVFGITGFPSGVINRKKFTANGKTAYAIHPSFWTGIIDPLIKANESALVDVRIKSWNINKDTKHLTVEVEAEMMADVPSQLAFNLLIMEDGQTGTTSKWEQHNYLSGNADFEDSKFFGLPDPIKNFEHENVLIHMADGHLGANGSFPSSAVKGQTYTKSYDIDLTKTALKYQNLDHLWIAALVNKTGSEYEILNAVSAGKKILPTYSATLSNEVSPEYLNVDKGQKLSKTVTLKNNNPVAINIQVSLDSASSIIPTDWVITDFEKMPKITIQPNAEAEIKYEITSNTDNPAYLQLALNFNTEKTDTYKGASVSTFKGILSKGAEIFMYSTSGITPQIARMLPNYKGKLVTVPFDLNAMDIFDHSSAKLSIFLEESTFDFTHNWDGAVTFEKFVKEALNNNKSVMISSMVDMYSLNNESAVSGLKLRASVKSMYNDMLKIDGYEGNKGVKSFVANNQLISNELSLSEHDVTKGLGETLDLNTSLDYGYSGAGDVVKSLDENVAKIIMDYSEAVATNPTGAVAAITLPKSKALYFGFKLDGVYDLNTRATLLNNSITWLLTPNSKVEYSTNTNIANIKISPNPTSDFVNVSLNCNEGDNGYVFVTDIAGKYVKTIVNNGLISPKYSINISDLSSGTYYIVTDINGVRSLAPVVINK